MREAVEAEFAATIATGARRCRTTRSRASTPISRRRALERAEGRERARRSGAARKDAKFADLRRSPTSRRTRSPGYAIVTISLKPIGGVPGDATRRPDGRGRRSRRGLFAATSCASRTSRTSSCRMSRSTICRRSTTASPRSASRRPTPASSPTSSPAPASTIARSPPRARSRSRSASPSASATARARARSATLKIKISGCINACGHHHVGHIGILGLERAGEETYQITLGGSGDETASIGEITGPGFSSEKVVDAVETVVETYMSQRRDAAEDFLADLSARRHGAVQGGALRAQRRIGHLR